MAINTSPIKGAFSGGFNAGSTAVARGQEVRERRETRLSNERITQAQVAREQEKLLYDRTTANYQRTVGEVQTGLTGIANMAMRGKEPTEQQLTVLATQHAQMAKFGDFLGVQIPPLQDIIDATIAQPNQEEIAISDATSKISGQQAVVNQFGAPKVIEGNDGQMIQVGYDGVRTAVGSPERKREVKNFQTDNGLQSAQEETPRFAANVEAGYPVVSATANDNDPDFGINKGEVESFREIEKGTYDAIDNIARIRDALSQEDNFTGLTAGTVRAINSGRDQMRQFSKLFAGRENPRAMQMGENGEYTLAARRNDDGTYTPAPEQSLYDSTNSYFFENIEFQAGESAAMKSNYLSLAYMLARVADPSGRLSDFDVRAQLESLYADSQAEGVSLRVLDEKAHALKQMYARQRQVYGQDEQGMLFGKPFPEELRAGELPSVLAREAFNAKGFPTGMVPGGSVSAPQSYLDEYPDRGDLFQYLDPDVQARYLQ